MIHLFLNGLGASAGAGLTYLYNVVPHLSEMPNVRTTLAVQPQLAEQFRAFPRVTLANAVVPNGTARRFWFEQTKLPALVTSSTADVLISAGNFAVRKPPVPQILLSGNSLYTSRDFCRDLRRRGEYRMWVDTLVKGIAARRSIQWADCTIAPSQAFAADLRSWTGGEISAVHHGFDPTTFFSDRGPLPREIQEQIESRSDCLRLLFVSHYNYYRNFETLIRAMPRLKEKLGSRRVCLFLTCKLRDGENPGTYRASGAAALVKQLEVEKEIVEVGAVPYRMLHHFYRACNIYVTPAYTETFAHPLVEAMASGLPVAAADLPVHREVCGDAARYFPCFSPESLAEAVAQIAGSEDLVKKMSAAGRQKALDFSWRTHVERLLELALELRSRAYRTEAAPLRAAGAAL